MKKVIAFILSTLMLFSVSVEAYNVECYDTTKRSIGEAADANGMTYEEYQKYMFINEDIPAWETERAAELKSYAMPIINVLGVRVDEFKSMFGLAIDITDTTTMCEVYDNMPLEAYWGTDFDAMAEYYGISDSITPETLYGTIRLDTEKKDMDSVNRVTFSDVGYKHWAHYYITEMLKVGVIDGYDDGTYLPEKTLTRAEFAKIFVMSAGIETGEENKYTDVSEDMWYAPYVNAMSRYMKDEDGKFNPEAPATREVVATAISRFLGVPADGSADLLKEKFTDADTVAEENARYVGDAVLKGIIEGYDDNTIRGKDTLTRAQAAAVMYRAAFEYYNIPKAYNTVVAKTGDVEITLGDAIYTVGVESDADLEDPQVLRAQLTNAVERTINMYRYIELAKKEGITLTDADIREGISLRSNYVSGIGYRRYSEYLASNGTSMEYFNKFIEATLYTNKLLEKYTEEDLEKAAEKCEITIYNDVIDNLTIEDVAMG